MQNGTSSAAIPCVCNREHRLTEAPKRPNLCRQTRTVSGAADGAHDRLIPCGCRDSQIADYVRTASELIMGAGRRSGHVVDLTRAGTPGGGGCAGSIPTGRMRVTSRPTGEHSPRTLAGTESRA
jgi:hypothetical protein